ncbi:MAG TPA: hypothetical protein VGT61_12400 [Thermomicrobiales bacterium]|jgi:hypothetical protein|nr:hypothetical protein [Thermomicrobiales bacterium]
MPQSDAATQHRSQATETGSGDNLLTAGGAIAGVATLVPESAGTSTTQETTREWTGNGVDAAAATESGIDGFTPSSGDSGPDLGGLSSALDGVSGGGSGCFDPGCSWMLLTVISGTVLAILL